eukprot:1139261-Pelagomonas_calceolata.AAC.1
MALVRKASASPPLALRSASCSLSFARRALLARCDHTVTELRHSGGRRLLQSALCQHAVTEVRHPGGRRRLVLGAINQHAVTGLRQSGGRGRVLHAHVMTCASDWYVVTVQGNQVAGWYRVNGQSCLQGQWAVALRVLQGQWAVVLR